MKVFDAHSDYAIKVYTENLLGKKEILKSQHLPKLNEGEVYLETVTVGGDFKLGGIECHKSENILAIIEYFLKEVNENKELFAIIKNSKDLEQLQKPTKKGFIMAIEGLNSVDRNLSTFDAYYELGVRSVSLTHNFRNIFAEGCMELKPGGLSISGKNLVKKLNDFNVVIDLSHISETCFFDVLEIYNKIPIASHSNAKTICEHKRNLTDDQIQALADRKGVIGMNFFGPFIDEDHKKVSLDRIVDHIDYIIDLVGVEHIGLGPDLLDYFMDETIEYIKTAPKEVNLSLDSIKPVKGCEDISKIQNILIKLDERGYSKHEIQKIASENFLSVYQKNFD